MFSWNKKTRKKNPDLRIRPRSKENFICFADWVSRNRIFPPFWRPAGGSWADTCPCRLPPRSWALLSPPAACSCSGGKSSLTTCRRHTWKPAHTHTAWPLPLTASQTQGQGAACPRHPRADPKPCPTSSGTIAPPAMAALAQVPLLCLAACTREVPPAPANAARVPWGRAGAAPTWAWAGRRAGSRASALGLVLSQQVKTATARGPGPALPRHRLATKHTSQRGHCEAKLFTSMDMTAEQAELSQLKYLSNKLVGYL